MRGILATAATERMWLRMSRNDIDMDAYKKAIYSYLLFTASIILMYGGHSHVCEDWRIDQLKCADTKAIVFFTGLGMFALSLVAFAVSVRIPSGNIMH